MRRARLAWTIGSLIGFAFGGRTALAQQTTSDSLRYRFRLLGVYDADSGDPIEGVDVIDVLSGTKATTNKSGVLSLFFLPDGGTLVRVRKVGYEMQTLPVSIARTDTLPVTVALKRAVQLPAIVVKDSATPVHISPRLRAFDERAREGFGQFVTEKELRKNDNTSLAQILPLRLSGLHALRGRSGTYLMSSREGRQCPVTVYLDDNPMPKPTDVSALRTDDFGGVEYYPGGASIPEKYNRTDSACGVLLLWTRES